MQEALDIRNSNRGIFGTSTKLEAALGWEEGKVVPEGWLQRANAAMAGYQLEVIISAKDGQQGHCLKGILDPANPEAVVVTHRGTGCCVPNAKLLLGL